MNLKKAFFGAIISILIAMVILPNVFYLSALVNNDNTKAFLYLYSLIIVTLFSSAAIGLIQGAIVGGLELKMIPAIIFNLLFNSIFIIFLTLASQGPQARNLTVVILGVILISIANGAVCSLLLSRKEKPLK
jgi:hypothetical protein